jgi:hypothetical protein
MPDQPIHPTPSAVRPTCKNIIICCDGTGNEFGPTNSNVLKLYTCLDLDDPDRQVAYYHPGVGTMGDPDARNWVASKWSVVKGLAFAAGFKDNVLDAYRYLMEVYNEGDQIYLCGFSRGAYTARALAGLLHGYGLLRRGNEGHLSYAWNLFVRQVKQQRSLLKKSHHKRPAHFRHTIEHDNTFAETFSRPVRLRFVAVWDTVSSIGWIYKSLRLLDMAQNEIIDVARHAVSIDERRTFYRDNLYGDPMPNQDIVQVWFAGAHSDVGGSYKLRESGPANVTLEWMIDEFKKNHALVCENRVDAVLGRCPTTSDLCNFYSGQPNPSTYRIHNSLDWRWALLQFIPQQHYDKDDTQINWRVPFWTPRQLPDGALIHRSVLERIERGVTPEEPSYAPRNLDTRWLHALLPRQASPETHLSKPPLYEAEGVESFKLRTRANIAGCLLYKPEDRKPPTPLQTFKRWCIVFAMSVIDILLVTLLASLLLRGLVFGLHRTVWPLLYCYHWLCVFWAWIGHEFVELIHHLLR